MKMSDFKTRLIAEKDELKEKVEKLRVFLESKKSEEIEEFQLTMLRVQLSAMNTYLGCLLARLTKL